MVKKFMDEDSFLNRGSVEAYVERYIEDFSRIPISEKSIIQMQFRELEDLLDHRVQSTKKQFTDKSTMESVPVIYDENGLIIWAPQNKEQCISLAQGRRWCTSQPGSGNLYYNYRYGSNNLTLYYVTDKELPFDDTNYASVILVDRNGGMRLADKSNGGNYGGSTVLPWSTIVSKNT